MLAAHLRRGAVAGAAGGAWYGAFVALVARPLVGHAESLAAGGGHHRHGAAQGHHGVAGGPLVDLAINAGAGAIYGALLGVLAFGVAYYVFEPALPDGATAKSALLGAAGFATVSGVPWLLFPPRPPGVEPALPIGARLVWYGVAMAVGVGACAVVLRARLRREAGRRTRAALDVCVAVAAIVALVAVAPTGPPAAASSAFAALYRHVVGLGAVGLWTVMAATNAWAAGRVDRDARIVEGAVPASGS